MPPFQSPKQQFILQHQETTKESCCSAAWASMDLTQVLPLHLVPGGIQQCCLSAGEAPWCLQVRLSPCWGVWLPELTSVYPQIAGQSLLLILVCVVKTSINAAAFWGQQQQKHNLQRDMVLCLSATHVHSRSCPGIIPDVS